MLATAPPSWRMAAIRTWTGGWVTDTRLRNADQGCLLGCERARDSLSHYIDCRRFLWNVAMVSRLSLPASLSD
eukprot:4704757-Pyramimonas_sp.AAC.1